MIWLLLIFTGGFLIAFGLFNLIWPRRVRYQAHPFHYEDHPFDQWERPVKANQWARKRV